MPWQETCAAEEQVRFIVDWQKGEKSFTALCRAYGISPKTGYKRVQRFQAAGWSGLGDRSRAPHHSPQAVLPAVATQLLAVRYAHPTWGPRKLLAYLAQQGTDGVWPAPSTVGDLLRRAGLVHPRRRVRRAVPWGQPFSAADAANSVWCVDFKGWFRTQDGKRCHPLTLEDAYSRYLLVCQGLEQPRAGAVRPVLERAFREYGLPQAIRSDNGAPFASRGLGGLSQLSVWWIKLGIVPERIEPGHPEQNGRLERLHRTLKAEATQPPQRTLRAQQRVLDAFRASYNTERPHAVVGNTPPASVYTPGTRVYPRRIAEPEYDREITVRRVRTDGTFQWRGAYVFVAEALAGERVGLVAERERQWRVQFGPLALGVLDERSGKIGRLPTKVLPMSPV